MSITRRGLIQCTAAAAVAGAALSVPAFAEEAEDFAAKVTKTADFDIVVVGAGPSGLAAAVQAADLGCKVVMLEVSDFRGGIIRGAEGMTGVNSPMEIEQGMEAPSIPAMVEHMCGISEYKVNGLFWKNMLERSGGNIAWLIEKGVRFSGQIDDYKGDGEWPVFHWFEGEFACPTSLGDPLEADFLAHEGCELLLETRGRQLKMVDGKVAGIYATTKEDVLEINAKAVILATGGFARNVEMVAETYPRLYAGRYTCNQGPAGCVGDGTMMARAAGGARITDFATFMSPRMMTINVDDPDIKSMVRLVNAPWVNHDGVRFVREDCGTAVSGGAPLNAMLQQWNTYVIVDADLLEATVEGGIALLEEEIKAGTTELFEGQTPEELAAAMGVDVEAFAKTIAEYNAMAEAGADTAFGKDPAYLVALTKAPFFAMRQIYSPYKILGSTSVNPKYEVIDAQDAPIPGLYASGTEANMNYFKAAYSYHCPGGCCAQAVDSGRVAAKNAVAYIG